jgi:hypothetical protein
MRQTFKDGESIYQSEPPSSSSPVISIFSLEVSQAIPLFIEIYIQQNLVTS